MKLVEPHPRHREGRDEMNLADFPISALPRAQKSDASGRKLDRLEFTATRYDPTTRGRVQQKVTLTSTARDGLPTPADEHVILALLYVAKHSNDFTDATVHFAPARLFEIMGWAPNGRSYTRLRDVLRRLKALTIRYEQAWWDVVGRGYEEELATGIVSGYRIARQVSGPRRPGQELASWVTWTQAFHESLKAGNLKRLDLEVFFKLQTPTAQRMYRFLDKRFYNASTVTMDLVEFACGHVGLTDAGNVAILKRRLAPAIEELEKIGFLRPAEPSARYQKVKVGQWRVVFEAAEKREPHGCPTVREGAIQGPTVREGATSTAVDAAPSLTVGPRTDGDRSPNEDPAAELVREFYRSWGTGQPGPRDAEQAELLLRGRDVEEARALLATLVQVVRKEWPECRSLSGAVQKYLGDAIRWREHEKRRAAGRKDAEQKRGQARAEFANRRQDEDERERHWRSLPSARREAIEARVRERLGGQAPRAFVHRLCLEEVTREGVSGGS